MFASRGPRPAAALVASILLSGCDRPTLPGPIPDLGAAVVRVEGGGEASLFVEFPRPGASPVVRVAPGVVALGPGWARTFDVAPDGDGHWRAELRALGPEDAHAELVLDERPELLAIDRDGAWLGLPDRSAWLSLADGAAPPTVVAGGQDFRAGPGWGFAMRLHDGVLGIRLPRMAPPQSIPLLQDVEAVLGTWWLVGRDLPPWERALADATFKEVAAIPVRHAAATCDGRLGEWRGDRALPVDDRAQVQAGAEHWTGPRDASFGVAARLDGGAHPVVHLAVRIRDDHVQPGGDRVEVLLPDRRITVPLARGEEHRAGTGWRSALAPPLGNGAALEIDVLDLAVPADAAVLPIVVRYVDVDADGGRTVLATASTTELVAFSAPGPTEM